MIDPDEERYAGAVAVARQAIQVEAAAVAALESRIDAGFARAVQLVLDCPGRTVLSGIGKSGYIARKLAATFSSTGTPAWFLHPAEGVHGDLGAVTREDVVIILSYSGESDEIGAILPYLKRLSIPLIAVARRGSSTLASAADVLLDVTVEREACPLNLAPTASTTAMTAMGDALAMAVMHCRSFTREQFGQFHPAGSLGRQLLTIDEVMRQGPENALVAPDAPLEEALWAMTRTRLGAAMVVNEEGILLGIITDGDVRRRIGEVGDIRHCRARGVMTANPRVVHAGRLAVEALAIMQAPPRPLNVLPVVDDQNRVVGATHIQDLVRFGFG